MTTTTTTRTQAAEVIFIESPKGGEWSARFLNKDAALGSILGRPVSERNSSHILTIREVQTDSPHYPVHYEWKTPGENTYNGNRHESAFDLSEAQAAVLKWAGRRFRTER